jgi:DNA-binding HxlR family transcriptional regulator
MENNKKRSDCPLAGSLDLFGDKWSLLIVRDMIFFDKSTYGDFLKSPERIATNILASRLQWLEENWFVRKLEHPESKAKGLYVLTEKSIELLPILVEIYLWAEKNLKIPDDLRALVEDARKDKDEFIRAVTKRLEKRIETLDR